MAAKKTDTLVPGAPEAPYAGTGKSDLDALPTKLSPSRALDFMQCPAKFYFKSILRLPSPATEATTKGTLAHEAFEKIFDFPKGERTPENAVPFVRVAWESLKDQANYAPVVALGPEAVEAMLCAAEDAVRAWFGMEDPNRFDPNGRELRLAAEAAGVPLHGILDRVDRVVYPSGEVRWLISDYKGLALDTPLPTPDGWTTMGEVRRGDHVMGADGRPTKVLAKSEVHNRPCYRLVFDDQSEIVCDNVHLWQVGASAGRQLPAQRSRVLDADGLFELWQHETNHGRPVCIDNSSPLDLPEADLPVDPYVLGAWLGADRSSGGDVVLDEAEIEALSIRLQELDVSGDKSVPQRYLRASATQRLELLRGLMDAAGSWHRTRHKANFTTTSANLAESVEDLVAGLGWRYHTVTSTFAEGHGSTPAPQTTFYVRFTPTDANPFTLPRKAELMRTAPAEARRRSIKLMEKVASVPTQCVMVDAPDSLYLAGRQMVPTHNTGKVPKPDDRFLDEKFFGMKVYAVLMHEMLGIVAHQLRLVYVIGGAPHAVRKLDCDEALITKTRAQLKGLWKGMKDSARAGKWAPRRQPLCQWCEFMEDLCPTWHPELVGVPVDVQSYKDRHAAQLVVTPVETVPAAAAEFVPAAEEPKAA